jgi:carboxymethylenebutenolidase
MCFSSDQRPPAPPKSSEIADHGPVELVAADGNRFAAYDAVPKTRRGASLVLLPDIRGLHAFYTDLALRCAEAGLDTVAIDPYGRTAGVGRRDDDFDYMPHARALKPEHVLADASAAAARLKQRSSDPVFTMGFCIFGGHSWRLAGTALNPAGSIGFYGRPATAMDVLHAISAPLLLLVAGADQSVPLEESLAFDQALTRAGKEHTTVVYEGAPHSFFDRSYEQWADACADAWKQVLGFIDAHR